MKRRTLIRCISLAPLAAGVSCGRGSRPGGQGENLQPGHDPRDFGAFGDGKTLDTAAMQAAIDASAATLGRVNLTGAVFLSGSLTLRDAACWVQTYRDCEDLVLDGLTVRSTTYWNNDGIDLYDCRRVVVRNCDIDCSDDGICLKSATPGKFCEDILVESCRLRTSASALKMGTSSHGGFRRITMPGGADPAVAHIPLDQLHSLPDHPQRYPEFSMFGELPSWALFLRHTRGIVLRQSRFDLKSPDFRPALVLDRSVDTELDGLSLDPKSGRPLIAAHASPDLRILNPSQALSKDDLRQWKTELATP